MTGSRFPDQPDVQQPDPTTGSNSATPKTVPVTANNEVEDKIRDELYAFCAELAQNLDKKEGIASKYFKVKSNNPVVMDEKADSESRKAFLANFSEFYKELREALDQVKKDDIKTITAEEKSQSEAFIKLKNCFEKLNKAGFYNANGRPINFWSGDEAQAEANQTLFSLSDADVPSISILSKLGNLLKDASVKPDINNQEQFRSLSDITFFAGSALFAYQASGNVYVYSSASNISEEERNIFTVNNFHWNIELGIVRAKQHAGDVKNIYYIGYSHSKNDWKQCGLSLVSLNENEELSENARKKAEENCTPVLVQKNNAFWMYGDPDGNGSWKLTLLDSLKDDAILLLKSLPFAGCDLLLLSLDENNEIENMDDTLAESRKTSSPILIKRPDNTFVLYGYQEHTGCWDFTLIETRTIYLNQLPFTEELTKMPRNHALFNQDLMTILSPGHSHFNGIIRGEDLRFTQPVIDHLKSGHANWQKLFNANNLSQNSLSLSTRRNSLEGFFKLSLSVSTIRNANTIYLESNPEGKGLDYEVIGPDGSLEMGTIPWDKLPRKLPDNYPQTIKDIRDITSTSLSPILTYVASQNHIELPKPEQKKKKRLEWIKTGPARTSTATSDLFNMLSPRLERSRSRSRSNSLSPSPSPRERSNSLSPRRPFFSTSPRRGSKQQISPKTSNAAPEEKPTTIITASEDVPILKKRPG